MTRTHRAALGVLTLLAAAAALAAPALAQPAAPAAAPDTMVAATGQPGAERWTLARCITTALERGGDARAARARTGQAKGAATAAWGGLLPNLSGGLSYGQSRPDRVAGLVSTFAITDTTQPGDPTYQYDLLLDRREDYSATASLDMNLFNLPAYAEKQRQNRLSRGAVLGEAETRNTVAFNVKRQYFELLKAARLAQVSRESEKLSRDEETRSEALFQVGTVARGDVLKARARRAQTQLDRIRAENQVEVQRSRLKQVMGVPPGTAFEIEEIMEEGVALPDSAGTIQNALRVRPLLAQSQLTERAARSRLFGAWTQRVPRVTGSLLADRSRVKARYEYEAADPSARPIATEEEDWYSTVWQGRVAVTIPIFDGLAIEGGIRSARGAVLEAESDRRQRELDIAVEVQTAWLALREAQQRIEVAREGLASAEEDYKFSKGRYDLGAGTFLDLLTAEVNLSQAKRAHVEALADAKIAEADLERAVGEKRY